MPLFHVHGLIGAMLSSLATGASIACTGGLDLENFSHRINEFKPTWYSATPAMLQAIMTCAEANPKIIASAPLRLIRSCSAPLPPQVMLELEQVFKVPVIEAYGMTEASHQIASNPLPPHERRAGSVGMAAGPEVAILDEAGTILKNGAVGEIAIRGANVMRGYENNSDENQKSFSSGWFRTGDQGYLDPDGYVFITGRLKEIINCGGKKISPLEVDEMLLSHPAVAEVATFAVPHKTLGDDVAAAILLRDNAVATESEFLQFAAMHLADFKVPRRVAFVDEIPKGPTGKVQRVKLAEKLELTATGQLTRPAPAHD
jgi:acyl-CoA synthetase (AMP-forming)/AMP-acid ligase II